MTAHTYRGSHLRRMHRGFTLLEVLVALALFAAVAAVVAQTAVNVMQSRIALATSRQNDGAITRWVIDMILRAETRDELEDGNSLSLPDGSVVEWTAELYPMEMVDVFALNLELEWRDPRGRRSINTVSTILHRPGWMTPQEREPVLRERSDKWQKLSRERNLTPR